MVVDFTEKKHIGRQAFLGSLLDVRVDEVVLPDGTIGLREYVVHPGAAMIIPVFEDGSVLLERQYRYPVGQHIYEFPAGKLDVGEVKVAAAKRELKEETGYIANDWIDEGFFYPNVGYSNEVIYLFIARDLVPQCANLDKGEFLETIKLPYKEAFAWMRMGKIRDAKTMIGLYLLKGHF